MSIEMESHERGNVGILSLVSGIYHFLYLCICADRSWYIYYSDRETLGHIVVHSDDFGLLFFFIKSLLTNPSYYLATQVA